VGAAAPARLKATRMVFADENSRTSFQLRRIRHAIGACHRRHVHQPCRCDEPLHQSHHWITPLLQAKSVIGLLTTPTPPEAGAHGRGLGSRPYGLTPVEIELA
jgi:hypothetical protein